jgi:ABC-type branched-subunit amino acid transport system ATPase component
MRQAAAVLVVEDLVAGYDAETDIVKGVSIILSADEIVTVVGPNGAGKSTLMKSIFGLVRPRTGRILFHGNPIDGLQTSTIARAGLGYVPQRDNVFPTMTVLENLEMGMSAAPGKPRGPRLEAIFGLFPRLAERQRQSVGSMSGGERQLVAMGRALMPEPSVLLLDEPSAGLSPMFVDKLFEHIQQIRAAGVAVLMVEQNARRALAISDRGYVLDLGQTRHEGRGSDLLDDPRVVDLYLGTASSASHSYPVEGSKA